jgi:hypothetical protein
MIVTPLAFNGAKNVLVDLLPLAVELWVFMIALVIFFDGIGILFRSISLPDALLVHKCFTGHALHFGFGIFLKL